MSSAHDELPVERKQELMNLIYAEKTHRLRPLAITCVQGVHFFPWYRNCYDGYFLTVSYADGTLQRWFVVDISAEHDQDWFLERIL